MEAKKVDLFCISYLSAAVTLRLLFEKKTQCTHGRLLLLEGERPRKRKREKKVGGSATRFEFTGRCWERDRASGANVGM